MLLGQGFPPLVFFDMETYPKVHGLPETLKRSFFNVGPPKEDIFPGHLPSPIFQSSYTSYNYKFPLTI